MLDDLFESMMKESNGSGSDTGSSGQEDMMMDMLGSILGGASSQSDQLPGGDLNSMLEGFLGGTPSSSGRSGSAMGLGSLLEMIIGGGGQMGLGANPLLAPITEALSEKLGVSPQVAAVIVTFAFTMLMKQMQKSAGSSIKETGTSPLQEGFDLDQLLDDDYLESEGITRQLSIQTGLDEEEAKEGLHEAVLMLSGQVSFDDDVEKFSKQPKGSELEDLLDTWNK
jgi:hypothetical protein